MARPPPSGRDNFHIIDFLIRGGIPQIDRPNSKQSNFDRCVGAG